MILHIMTPEKFLPPFIDFVDKHFGRSEHKYVFITSEKYLFGLTPEHNVEFLCTDEDIFTTLLGYMVSARKIILHGLWRDKIDLLLLKNPALLAKSYWVMWGGDFYYPEKQTENRYLIIKEIHGLLTYIPQDVEYVRNNYNALGKHYPCVMYPSNVFEKDCPILHLDERRHTDVKVIVGNSATETNNHYEVIDKLSYLNNEGFSYYFPLSYGNAKYAENLIAYGQEKLGKCFFPITNYVSLDEYNYFLESVDAGVFNHDRQQAMGVSISLIGMGKKLYLRRNSPQWLHFSALGIEVFDLDEEPLRADRINQRIMNSSIIKKVHSSNALREQWRSIFYE